MVANELLKEAIEAAVTSPTAFMALGLLLIVPLINTIVDKKDHTGLRYASLFSVIFLAIAGFSWSVYGHYVAAKPSAEQYIGKNRQPLETATPLEDNTSEDPAFSVTTPEAAVTGAETRTETQPTEEPVAQAREDCGEFWSGWIEVGGGVGNPCPSGCTRGREVGQSYRVVGFPPRPQTKHKFQCWR